MKCDIVTLIVAGGMFLGATAALGFAVLLV